mgnify:CR=1 FL=1
MGVYNVDLGRGVRSVNLLLHHGRPEAILNLQLQRRQLLPRQLLVGQPLAFAPRLARHVLLGRRRDPAAAEQACLAGVRRGALGRLQRPRDAGGEPGAVGVDRIERPGAHQRLDHPAVERHVAAVGVAPHPVHAERLVAQVLEPQEAFHHVVADPGGQPNRRVQVDSSANRIGIVPDEAAVERRQPVRADLDVVVDVGKVGSGRLADAGIASVVEALLTLVCIADGDRQLPRQPEVVWKLETI